MMMVQALLMVGLVPAAGAALLNGDFGRTGVSVSRPRHSGVRLIRVRNAQR